MSAEMTKSNEVLWRLKGKALLKPREFQFLRVDVLLRYPSHRGTPQTTWLGVVLNEIKKYSTAILQNSDLTQTVASLEHLASDRRVEHFDTWHDVVKN